MGTTTVVDETSRSEQTSPSWTSSKAMSLRMLIVNLATTISTMLVLSMTPVTYTRTSARQDLMKPSLNTLSVLRLKGVMVRSYTLLLTVHLMV